MRTADRLGMHRRLRVVLVVLLLAMVTACAEDKSAEALGGATREDVDAVVQAVGKTKQAGTLRYTTKQSLKDETSGGEQEGLTRTGKVDFLQGAHEQAVKAPNTDVELKFFVTDGQILLSRPEGNRGPGEKTWSRLPATSELGDLNAVATVDLPHADVLAAVSLPGTRQKPADGEAQRFSLHVPESAALPLISGRIAYEVAQAVGAEEVDKKLSGRVPVEVGLDSSGRVVSFSADLGGLLSRVAALVPKAAPEVPLTGITLTFDMEVSEFGEPVNLTVPPTEEIG